MMDHAFISAAASRSRLVIRLRPSLNRRWPGIQDAKHHRRVQPRLSGNQIEEKAQFDGCDRRPDGQFIVQGVPGYIRSDNGPEFIAEAVWRWIKAVGAETMYIEPEPPWENGYCESFNARFRDELVKGENFYLL